jgi:hypothetical protein
MFPIIRKWTTGLLRIRIACYWAAMVAILVILSTGGFAATQSWEPKALDKLCTKYLGASPPSSAGPAEERQWLDRLTRQIGAELEKSGEEGVPREDLALLALLQARMAVARSNPAEAAQQPGPPSQPPTSVAAEQSPGSAQALQTAKRAESAKSDPQTSAQRMANIEKGQEGIRQAEEQLAKLPLSQRMVITGDLASVLQAATVPDGTNLATTVGRARVNFVLRAFSGSKRYGLGKGYFFARMEAAGGAPDSSVVGGPTPFTPFDQIAVSRSLYNQSSRGNLYLEKAFYQQRVNLGNNYIDGRIGVIDLTDYFDTNLFANNEARQFLNYAFVNNPAFKGGIVAPGVMAEYHHPVNRDWLHALVIKGGYAVTRTDRAFSSPLWTGELQLDTLFGGREGHFRFGGSLGNRAGAGAITDFYVSTDQWLRQKFGIFGRYGISNSGMGSLSLGPVHQAYSAGVQWQFSEPDDRISAWSLGFSQAFPIATGSPLASEKVIETYYRWQWSQNISVSPDFQLVFGSGGKVHDGTQFVLGTRMDFSF